MATQFPTRRFSGAGATREEVNAIREEYDRSDISIQRGMIDHLRSLSTSGVREYLNNWRQRSEPSFATEEALEAPGSLETKELDTQTYDDEEDDSAPDDPGTGDSDTTD